MSRVCVEIPGEIIKDMHVHIGEDKKFVNMSDAIRAACRKLLDQLDEIDARHGRTNLEEKK